jgi:RNA polymerase sigma-70 factor (ECF subfamily)
MPAEQPAAFPTPPPASAAAALYERYASRLIRLAGARLDVRLRPKVDPEDVVQSAFRTFFRRAAAGEFSGADEAGLWPLLARITLRKCHGHADHFFADKRDVRREEALAEEVEPRRAELPEGPAPEETAILLDLIERLRGELGSERKRQILDLSLQGYSVAEISAQVGYYERGVERTRAEIRRRLEELS